MVSLVVWLIAGLITSRFITKEKNDIVPVWRQPVRSEPAGDDGQSPVDDGVQKVEETVDE